LTRDERFASDTPLAYCTDNGAMVAALGYHLLARGHLARLDLTAVASAEE
jgi:tRNA A37 threonylcarbamoyltransferase TsaD